MVQPRQLHEIALTARILGILFSYSPDSELASPLATAILDAEEVMQWPYGDEAHRLRCANLLGETAPEESLREAYLRLFIGPSALPAPPWGSVYLDRESVLFGESTLALRQWMRENGVEWRLNNREPEDHFGTLLLLCAWLAESRPQLLTPLLELHLLPWCFRYLALMEQDAGHPFYQGLTELAQLTIHDWQEQLKLQVAEQELFR